MGRFITAILVSLFVAIAHAQVYETFTYEGFLTDTSDAPVLAGNVAFRLQIRSDDASDCLLYEWTSTLDMSTSGGHFAITVGGASGSRTDSTGITLKDIFSQSIHSGLTCNGGGSSISTLARKLDVSVNVASGGWNDFGTVRMTSSPRALTAQYVGGTSESQILKTNTNPAIDLTQASLEEFFNVIKGGANQSVRWNGTSFSAYNPADGANLNAGSVTDAAIDSVAWSKVTGAPTNLTQIGGLSCANGEVMVYNGTAWTCGAGGGGGGSGISSLNGSTDGTQTFAVGSSGTVPAWNTAGGAHTLNIPAASAVGVSGGLLSNADYTAFGTATATVNGATSTVTGASNLVLRDVSGGTELGYMQLRVNGSTVQFKAIDSGTSHTVYQFPQLAGGASDDGKILRNASSGLLQWSSLSLADLRGTSGSQLPVASCNFGEALSWNSITDALECQTITLASGGMRTVGPMTIYVRTSGNDISGDGSSTSPFASLQRALDSLPPYLIHDVTIDIDGTYNLNQSIVVGKTGSLFGGAMLTIGGALPTEFSNNMGIGASGMILLPNMQNIKLKNIRFSNFQGQSMIDEGTGLRVDGATVLLDNVDFQNNRVGLSVDKGGKAFFFSTGLTENSFSISPENEAKAIMVQNGTLGSSNDAGIAINLSSSDQSAIGIEGGEMSTSGYVSINFLSCTIQCTGIDLHRGGYVHAEGAISIDMGGASNSGNSGVRVSSSNFRMSQGPNGLTILNWQGQASPLYIENGGRAYFGGYLDITGSGTMSAIYVTNQSALTLRGGSNISSTFANQFVSVSQQSSVIFESNSSPSNWIFNGSGSLSGAIQARDQSLIQFAAYAGGTVNLSGSMNFASLSGGSRFSETSGSLGGGGILNVSADTTSTVSQYGTRFNLSGGAGASDTRFVDFSGAGSPYNLNDPDFSLALNKTFLFRVQSYNGGSQVNINGGSNIYLFDSLTGSTFAPSQLEPGKIYRALYDGTDLYVSEHGQQTRFIRTISGLNVNGGTVSNHSLGYFMGDPVIHCMPLFELDKEIQHHVFVNSGDYQIRFTNNSGSNFMVNGTFRCVAHY